MQKHATGHFILYIDFVLLFYCMACRMPINYTFVLLILDHIKLKDLAMTLSVKINALHPHFTVCGQISISEVEEIARLGFRSLINNRPDGEGGPDQPTSEDIKTAALAAGLAYLHYPISSPAEAAQHSNAYQQACAQLPLPAFAFCRSGARSTALFQACAGNIGYHG